MLRTVDGGPFFPLHLALGIAFLAINNATNFKH
jgi:hypothetical protein